MTSADHVEPTGGRAFTVPFAQLTNWGVGSYVRVQWLWPDRYIRRLSAALKRRVDEADRGAPGADLLQLLTIRFDGSIEARPAEAVTSFKGKLFHARPTDVVFSKIDVRNGAIGVVPAEMTQAVVSAEYPVYAVDHKVALPAYIKLLFRTEYFRRAINGMVSGASGRKRVQPAQIEVVEVPLPPLNTQAAIVDRWDTSVGAAAEALERVAAAERALEERFYAALGVQRAVVGAKYKAFAIPRSAATRWAVTYAVDDLRGVGGTPPASFPYLSLGSLASVSYGITKSPANRPKQKPRPYLRVANVRRGYLDLSDMKYIEVSDDDLETYRLVPGDILFVEGNGSRAELGRVAMWSGEIPDCVHQNHLIRVRVRPDVLSPEFAMTWFNTEIGRAHFFRAAKSSSGLGTINSTEVRSAPIPVPPIAEQTRILDDVRRTTADLRSERIRIRAIVADAQLSVERSIMGADRLNQSVT